MIKQNVVQTYCFITYLAYKNIFSKICPDSQVGPLGGSGGGHPMRARYNGQAPMIV